MNDFTPIKNEAATLDELATAIYRNLTATRYLKDIKYSEFIHYTKQQLTKYFQEQTELQATIYLINRLLILANHYDTYSLYENRFERYIALLLKKQYPLIERSFTYEQNRNQLEEAFLESLKNSISSFTFQMIEKCLWKNKFHAWQTWLQNPTFDQYKKIQATFSESEQQASTNYVLAILKENLFSPTIQLTYLHILIEEERFDDVIDYFLTVEHQPMSLNEGKKGILQKLENSNKTELLPVYHQFIIRLIEKKTRAHYDEAIMYMKKLQKIYDSINQSETFKQYLRLLMKKYSSYRALIQEMKRLEANIQSK